MGIDEIENVFSIYLNEIDRCEQAKCYWALLHLLLTIPDVCGALEKPKYEVVDRYVKWCEENMPHTTNIKASDRYQMRNSLLHTGSSTVHNRGNKYASKYSHFSYVDPETMAINLHDTVDDKTNILNINIKLMAKETKEAIDHWFHRIRSDSQVLRTVVSNLSSICRVQTKSIPLSNEDEKEIENKGETLSST